jgi:hypothetical protein
MRLPCVLDVGGVPVYQAGMARRSRTPEEELNRPAQLKPLYERIQEWVFRMDVSHGVHWFRLGLFGLLVFLVILLYTGTQFFGLSEPEVMDRAQVGRNLAKGRGYTTQNLRPSDLWHLTHLKDGRSALAGEQKVIPDLWTPPVYPFLLSVVFRVIPVQVDLTEAAKSLKVDAELPRDFRVLESYYEVARLQAMKVDRLLVLVGWLLYLAGMVLLYLLARDLFDHRVAVTSVFLYLFCDPLLDAAIGGSPVLLLAVLFMVAALGLIKAERWEQEGRPKKWVTWALVSSAGAVGLGTLTEYLFASVIVPLLVYVGVMYRKGRRAEKIGLCVGVIALVLFPWMTRNWVVSRTLFGMAPTAVYEGVKTGPGTEVKPGQLQRTYSSESRVQIKQVVRKMIVNLSVLYGGAVKDVGGNYLLAFFLVSLLHRFRSDEVFRLRRFVFWGLLACVVWISAAGQPHRNYLNLFLPLIIIYGTAFFYVMFERLQFRTRFLRNGMVGLFVGMNSLPFLFTILPPAPRSPYPPYDSGVVAVVGNVFREKEVLVSDIPWAVAWYGDRSTVWAPTGEQDFMAINYDVNLISGVYLTQEILMQSVIPEIAKGQRSFWTQMYEPPKKDFPLQFSRPLTLDGQQILLSNRVR